MRASVTATGCTSTPPTLPVTARIASAVLMPTASGGLHEVAHPVEDEGA